MFLCNTDPCTVVQTLAHTSYTFTHPQSSTKSTMIKKTKLLVYSDPDLLSFFPSIFSISIEWVVMVEHMVPWDPGCRISDDAFKCIHKMNLNGQLLFKPNCGYKHVKEMADKVLHKYLAHRMKCPIELSSGTTWTKTKIHFKMVQSAIKFGHRCHFSNRNKWNKYYSSPNHGLYILNQ